ncbi:MAG: DinB family protein [Fimbriimonadaceae bacterium]|nr:DinB family protein [Fimbriimonadaceae bacterium]
MPGHYDLQIPDGFDPQVALLLGALQDSTREWRDNLGKPPVEAIVWQPYPHAHSIGAELLHMADTDAYWFETFAAGKARPRGEIKRLMVDQTKIYGAKWPEPPREPIEWYFDMMDRIRERSVEALRGLSADTLYERKTFSCTLRWVLAHVVEHDSYHGGQAVLLHELWKKDQGKKR